MNRKLHSTTINSLLIGNYNMFHLYNQGGLEKIKPTLTNNFCKPQPRGVTKISNWYYYLRERDKESDFLPWIGNFLVKK